MLQEQRAYPGDLTKNVSNYLSALPYSYYIVNIGIVALPCALQLFSNCSVPDILVDVVPLMQLSTVNVAPKLLAIAKTPLSIGVTAFVKELNAKYEHMQNVKAQIPKLKLRNACFRTKSRNFLPKNFPAL